MSKYSVMKADINLADNLIAVRFEHIVNQSADFVLTTLSKRTLRSTFSLAILMDNTLSNVSWHGLDWRSHHRQSSKSLEISEMLVVTWILRGVQTMVTAFPLIQVRQLSSSFSVGLFADGILPHIGLFNLLYSLDLLKSVFRHSLSVFRKRYL